MMTAHNDNAQSTSAWQRNWHQRLLDWLYPVSCHGCGEAGFMARHHLLCPGCQGKIALLFPGNSCRRCAAPLGEHSEPGPDCVECRGTPPRFTRAVALARYQTPLRELILALKFRDERPAAGVLAILLHQRLTGEEWLPKVEAVLPVPLHPQRQRERGYNQSHLLAAKLAELMQKPLRLDLIERSRHTHPQAELGRELRRTNVRGAFRPVSAELNVKTCLLVDDVMTTGATASECAAALRAGGVESIYTVTVGR